MAEKKLELEKRLQDVSGQLASPRKAAKKGMLFLMNYFFFKTVCLVKPILEIFNLTVNYDFF